MLCHLLTKLELTASASMAQRLTDDCVSQWVKDGKRAFNTKTPSQNGWLTTIDAVQHVWRTLRSAGFHYLETRSLNQDPLENTFSVIRLHFGSNNNPTVGQFVDALNTSIINGLAYKCLRNANSEGDDTKLSR